MKHLRVVFGYVLDWKICAKILDGKLADKLKHLSSVGGVELGIYYEQDNIGVVGLSMYDQELEDGVNGEINIDIDSFPDISEGSDNHSILMNIMGKVLTEIIYMAIHEKRASEMSREEFEESHPEYAIPEELKPALLTVISDN